MTREVAKGFMLQLSADRRLNLSEREAVKMAIIALEKEPCDDAVSRQAVEKITWEEPSYSDALNVLTEVRDKVRALPSVTPIQRWIPVSERLPEDGYWEIFTNGKQISIERYKHDALDHFYPSGRFFNLEDAVAWMPFPERYKGESEK